MPSSAEGVNLKGVLALREVGEEIGPLQCRAGRVLLGWSQVELATAAKVGRSSVYEFEIGARLLSRKLRRAVGEALAAAGVEFIADDGDQGVGVRLRVSEVELAGCALYRDKDWAIIPVRYHRRDYRALTHVRDLERLASRRFFSDEQLDESVRKFKREVLAGALRTITSDPSNTMPIIGVVSTWAGSSADRDR